jgi:uncharacterized protein YggT (Ycf19 family)
MRRKPKRSAFYQEATQPLVYPMSITTPIPRYLLPRESRVRRARRGIKAFFAAIVAFINFWLSLALVLTLLLLFARFMLHSSNLTIPYSALILHASAPLVNPLTPYLPSITVANYSIDVATLATMLICLVAVLIVRGMLKRLVR